MELLKRFAGSASSRVGRAAFVAAAAAALSVTVVVPGNAGASTNHRHHAHHAQQAHHRRHRHHRHHRDRRAVVHSDKLTVVKTAKYGEVLAAGDTVYTLKPDAKACTAAKCFKYWPPVVLPKGVKHPIAGSGVTASKLGTKSVKGTGLEVTYGGKVLYWYYKDTAPGQVHGDVTDTWGKWTAVVLVKPQTPPPTSTTTSTTTGTKPKSPPPPTTTTTTPGTGGVSF